MSVTITAREFNQNASAAARLARIEPVTITDRGKEAFVLLNIEDFRKLAGESVVSTHLANLIADIDNSDVDDALFDDIIGNITSTREIRTFTNPFDEDQQ